MVIYLNQRFHHRYKYVNPMGDMGGGDGEVALYEGAKLARAGRDDTQS